MAVASAAQTPVGALAVDEGQGDQYGWAVDYETAATARARALGECGCGLLGGSDVRAVCGLRRLRFPGRVRVHGSGLGLQRPGGRGRSESRPVGAARDSGGAAGPGLRPWWRGRDVRPSYAGGDPELAERVTLPVSSRRTGLREKRMAGKTLAAAAAAAGMSERAARKWQSGALPSTAKAPRTWRPPGGPVRRRVAVGGRSAAGGRHRRTTAGADAVQGAVPAASGSLSAGAAADVAAAGPRLAGAVRSRQRGVLRGRWRSQGRPAAEQPWRHGKARTSCGNVSPSRRRAFHPASDRASAAYTAYRHHRR